MKFRSKFLVAGTGLAALLNLTACQKPQSPFTASNFSAAATPAYQGSAGTPDRDLVCGFESGASVNPYLFELNNPPGYQLKSPGGAAMGGAVQLLGVVSSPGADNTQKAFNVSGNVSGSGYPESDLEIRPEANSVYDARFFTGVQFYLKVMPDDTAVTRRFSIPVVQTEMGNGGTCTSGCYDHFGAPYSSTNGNWQLLKFDFSSLTRQGFGGAVTPATLSGANLQQVLWLQWGEGNNNVGTVHVDFWVDQVRFY